MNTFEKGLIMYLLCLVSPALQAQEMQYRIIWKKDSVGYIRSNLYDSAGYDIYEIYSESSYWFFGRKYVTSEYRSVFNDAGVLVQSMTRSTKNGSITEESSSKLSGDRYLMIRDEDSVKKSFDNHIQQTIAQIYYREPSGVTELFSERYNLFLQLHRDEDNTYVLTKPNGRENRYYFKSGICDRVDVDHGLINIHFERIN